MGCLSCLPWSKWSFDRFHSIEKLFRRRDELAREQPEQVNPVHHNTAAIPEAQGHLHVEIVLNNLDPTSFDSNDTMDGSGSNLRARKLSQMRRKNMKVTKQLHAANKLRVRAKQSWQEEIKAHNATKMELGEKLHNLKEKHETLARRARDYYDNNMAAASSDMQDTIDQLNRDNATLEALVASTAAQAFSLKASPTVIPPTEFTNDFKNLVYSVSNWVDEYVTPVVADVEGSSSRRARLQRVPQDHASVVSLRKILRDDGDSALLTACKMTSTDEDVVTALIFRCLCRHIFWTVLCGIDLRVATIENVYNLMSTTALNGAAAPPDLIISRSWRSDALMVLSVDPSKSTLRQWIADDLSLKMASGLDFLVDLTAEGRFRAFRQSIRERIIVPAIRLHEKMVCAKDEVFVSLKKYEATSDDGKSLHEHQSTTAEFYQDLKHLRLTDITRPERRRLLSPSDFPEPGIQYQGALNKICTVIPSLRIRQVKDGADFQDPEILVKQEMLVVSVPAPGPPRIPQGRTFIDELCFPGPT